MAEKFVKRYVRIAYIGGEMLRLKRDTAGLTQTELAEKLTNLTGIKIDQQRISDREDEFEFPAGPRMLAAMKKILKIR